MSGPDRLRVLIVEDSEDDAELAVRALGRAGWTVTHRRVEVLGDLCAALHDQSWDLVLSDYSLPELDVSRTLEAIAVAGGAAPVIVLSGRTGEEAAVEVMRAGADDFVTKQRLDRLAGAVERVRRDFAERRRHTETAQALREIEGRFRAVVDSSIDAIITIDERGLIETVNPAAERMFGYAADQAIGANVSLLMPEPYRGEHDGYIRRYVEDGRGRAIGRSRELVGLTREGAVFPIEVNLTEAWVGQRRVFTATLRDVSERKAFEARLAHDALHDPLTGLANRMLLVDRVSHAHARATRHSAGAALLLMDLDRFKVINDSLGHVVGDDVLRVVAHRLTSVVRPSDVVARFGGDEFVMLCEDAGDEHSAVAIAERVNEVLREPLRVADTDLVVSASIGIALVDGSSRDAEGVLRDADAAMYQAKANGGDRYAFFDQGLRARAVARLETEQALRRAFDGQELRVYFQPELSLVDGRVTGVEALVRWQHPERGLLGPGEFLAVAEETGLIVPIGNWVLAEAHRQAMAWASQGLAPPRVWVNASVRQLLHPDFLRTVADTLAQGEPQVRLGIEITEDTLVSDPRAITMTSELDQMGVHVAIDDFGTGYSSLSYLNRLHVRCLKVDRSFVGGLGRSFEDTAVTMAVVGLGQALDLDVIAEGVETPEQADILHGLGCRGAQGYYFARPLDAGAAAHFLATAPAR